MCNVSKMVNRIFNVQILIYSFTKFVYLSIIGYFIYTNIRKKTDFTNLLNLVSIYVFDGIVGVLKIPLTTYDCEYVMKQVRNLFLNLFYPHLCFYQIVCFYYEYRKTFFIITKESCKNKNIKKHFSD